jgi:hypothetical protein
LHFGDTKPCIFGTIHTCLLAVALVHVSSRDVMGFEGLRSEVQLYRLDWAEGQTENTWVPVCRVSGLIRRSVCTCTMTARLLVGFRQ